MAIDTLTTIQTPVISPEESLRKIDTLTVQSHRNLYSVSTVFPFTFFTTEIVVSDNSVDLVYHTFFFSQRTFPMLIKDIKNVKASSNIFFSSIEFELQGYETNPPSIKFLPSEAAIKIKRIVMGLLICQQKGVDLSVINTANILDKIIEIGTTQSNINSSVT